MKLKLSFIILIDYLVLHYFYLFLLSKFLFMIRSNFDIQLDSNEHISDTYRVALHFILFFVVL